MSVITFPSSLQVAKMTWGQQRRDMQFKSIFGVQVVEASPPLWTVSIELCPMYQTDAGTFQALLMQLAGSTNQLAVWNMARPAPVGTMRGSMTLSTGASQGATTLSITAGAGQGFKTLKAGDFLGVGSGSTQQVVMVVADATANASGVISVQTQPPLRNGFSVGAAITWDKPTGLFRRQDSSSSWDYDSVIVSGAKLDLIEDVRP